MVPEHKATSIRLPWSREGGSQAYPGKEAGDNIRKGEIHPEESLRAGKVRPRKRAPRGSDQQPGLALMVPKIEGPSKWRHCAAKLCKKDNQSAVLEVHGTALAEDKVTVAAEVNRAD